MKTTKRNYAAEVRRLIEIPSEKRLPLTRYYVVCAEQLVLNTFPPLNADQVFRMTAALNLLNAAVKKPNGRRLVSYDFIKGYASLVFTQVLRRRLAEVSVCWDADEQVGYLRVFGVQMGFHYMPMTAELLMLLSQESCEVQQWDGVRLQEIAVELFLLANPEVKVAVPSSYEQIAIPAACFRSPIRSDELRKTKRKRIRLPASDMAPSPKASVALRSACQMQQLMECPKRRRFKVSMKSLQKALHFSMERSQKFTLFRRRNRRRPINFIYYNGHNYRELLAWLTVYNRKIYPREEDTLTAGRLYFVSPQMHIESLPPGRRLLLLGQYNYVWNVSSRCYFNLCITYEIACYIASRYPQLRFINLLNYNRWKVAKRYYTYRGLQRVPPRSKARKLKVWMVIDRDNVLAHFTASMLPIELFRQYRSMPDYYMDHEVVSHNGLFGLYAYQRFHLLPTCYRRISIWGHYAYVTRLDGMMAIYGLQEECFKTDFCFHAIWYDRHTSTFYGKAGEMVVVICRLYPQCRYPWGIADR